MKRYDYTYILNNESRIDEVCRTAVSQGDNGSFVVLIIDGADITLRDLCFGKNTDIVISAAGERITFEGCTFEMGMSGIENNGDRVLFNRCTFEYENAAVKSTGYEVFNACTFKCMGNDAAAVSAFRDESMLSKLNYTVIMNSDIYIEDAEMSFITEGDAAVTLVNVAINAKNSYVLWTKDMANENTFSYYNCTGISGINECGYELSKEAADLYSISNLLSMEDNVFYINTEKNLLITAGEDEADISLYFYSNTENPFVVRTSEGISIRKKDACNGKIIFGVKGENDGEEFKYGFISFETSDGLRAECVVKIMPSMIEPPKFLSAPEIIIKDGKAYVSYQLDLNGREDLSEISWYRVDNIDRAKLFAMLGFERSNEKDCRKTAISRMKPCREIQLTPYDIGKHIKVNVKPRHARSESGAGLNMVSRIIMQSDIKSESIIINVENQVLNPYYRIEAGYGTAVGLWLYKKLPMCRHYDMVTGTNECGYYFAGDIPRENMTVYVILDFENNNGGGFGSRGEYQEIYIKYNAEQKAGYGVRYECIDSKNNIAGVTLYKYDGLNAQPISETVSGSILKSGMDIRADIYENIFTVQILIPDIDEPIKLSAKIDGNSYSGMGIKHRALSLENNRIGIRHIEMSFPS